MPGWGTSQQRSTRPHARGRDRCAVARCRHRQARPRSGHQPFGLDLRRAVGRTRLSTQLGSIQDHDRPTTVGDQLSAGEVGDARAQARTVHPEFAREDLARHGQYIALGAATTYQEPARARNSRSRARCGRSTLRAPERSAQAGPAGRDSLRMPRTDPSPGGRRPAPRPAHGRRPSCDPPRAAATRPPDPRCRRAPSRSPHRPTHGP